MGKRVRGSIRRLPSGRWQVRYTGLDGLRRTLEQTHRTKAEAEAAYAIVAADMATGRWVDPSLAGVTFGTYAARWVAERATITGRTRELYGTLLRLHLAPVPGRGPAAVPLARAGAAVAAGSSGRGGGRLDHREGVPAAALDHGDGGR